MVNRLPSYLRISMTLCRLFSGLMAGLHYSIVSAGLLKIPLCVVTAPGGLYKNLQSIWISRIFRRFVSVLVRTPLRDGTLRLVNFTKPQTGTGCVIVACHTPWSRLIVQWCLKNDFALIITANKSNQNANKIQKKGRGFMDLRHLLKHLGAGGRIIIMGDVFNNLNNCPVHFFEKNYNASLLPARLAETAGVPLMAVAPELRNGTIHINTGPQSDLKKNHIDACTATKNFLTFFEMEIRRNPSIWSVFVCESLSKYQNSITTASLLNRTEDSKQVPEF